MRDAQSSILGQAYREPAICHAWILCHLFRQSIGNQQEVYYTLRTAHDELHVAHETMNDLKGLCSGHSSLVEGEAVHSMEHIFDLILPQQFLCKLL